MVNDIYFSIKVKAICDGKNANEDDHVYQVLTNQLDELLKEEEELRERRLILENEVKKLKDLI